MTIIDQVLTKYISRDNVDHAIMITGAWGSGKTHYWNHSIVPLIEKTKGDDGKGLKPIYISLYGVSSIADLESNLFWHMALSGLDPKQHKWVKGGAMIAKGLLGVVSTITAGGGKASFDLEPSALFKDVDLKASIVGEMKKYVVCFDDLERCNIPIPELLGFINHYVEHQGMKTLIIAHESEVGHLSPKAQDESPEGTVTKEFDKVKEKVIGRILTYSPDIAFVCPQLIEAYRTSDPEFFDFMQTNSDVFVRQLVKFKVDNFRSIRFILDNLREQFNAVGNKELISSAFQKLLLFNTIIALEYKKGLLTTKDVNDPHNLGNLYQLNRLMSLKKAKADVYEPQKPKEEVPKELKYIERIVSTYLTDENEPITDFSRGFRFLPSVYAHILTGALDVNELERNLSALLPENVPPHIAAFRRLLTYEFRGLEEADFRELSKEVWDYAKSGTYVIYDYSQIASFYKFFIKNGLVKRNEGELENMVQNGIVNSIKKGNTPTENNHLMETNLMFSSGDEFVDRVVKPWIQSAHDSIKSKAIAHDASDFLRLVEEGDQQRLAEFMKSRHVTPFLQQIGSKRLGQWMKTLRHQSLWLLIAHIQRRYKSNYPDYLTAERDTLQLMLEYLQKEAVRLGSSPIRKFNVTELVKSLEEAIAAIDEASPKSI